MERRARLLALRARSHITATRLRTLCTPLCAFAAVLVVVVLAMVLYTTSFPRQMYIHNGVSGSTPQWNIVETSTNPSFYLVTPHPRRDRFVSWSIAYHGTWEPHIERVLARIADTLPMCSVDPRADLGICLRHRGGDHVNATALAAQGDAAANHHHPRFIDVGANVGFFSFWAAARGYAVTMVEAQQRLIPILEASRTLNDFDPSLTQIVHRIVSTSGEKMFIKYGGIGENSAAQARDGSTNWGGSYVTQGPNKGNKAAWPGHWVDTVSLTDVIAGGPMMSLFAAQKVQVLKIDVEGHEYEVVRSGTKAFAAGMVENVIMECCSSPKTTELLEHFTAWGFRIHSIPEDGSDPFLVKSGTEGSFVRGVRASKYPKRDIWLEHVHAV